MSTRPRFVSLDTADLTQLGDLVVARAGLLGHEQHALMTEFGGPPQARTVYWATNSGTTITRRFSVRVPPGVTHVDLGVLCQGNGKITFTTSTDTGSVVMRVSVEYADDYVGGYGSPEHARWVRTSGLVDTSDEAFSGGVARAIQVRSSVAWTFVDQELTVELDPYGTLALVVWALVVTPIHVAR